VANSNTTSGVGFWGALALMFIAFKLTGYIDWSWWWVLAPLWVPIVLALAIVCVIFLISLVLDWDGNL
jgi:hypothetical protein